MKTTLITLLFIFTLVGCNLGSSFKGHFSQKVANLEEPQTDDERTLVGEFNDYLLLTDSLAEIWNSTDTLNMRRLFVEIEEQRTRVDRARKFKNVRRSLNNQVGEQSDAVFDEIRQKFPKELREEWHSFYFKIYHCRSIWKNDHHRPHKWQKVYQNTLGEHYVLVNIEGKTKKIPVYFEDGKYYEDCVKPYWLGK